MADPNPDGTPLVPRKLPPLTGEEALTGANATVGDFWAWAFSELRENTTRGMLAEYLVSLAVGAKQPVRNAWDNYDVLTPHGVRIEVKASAYLQAWPQQRRSTLGFSGLFAREWDQETFTWSAERRVRADVFVFCVQTEKDPDAYDPLDVTSWDFYAVNADTVRGADVRSVSMAWVERHASASTFTELPKAIQAAA